MPIVEPCYTCDLPSFVRNPKLVHGRLNAWQCPESGSLSNPIAADWHHDSVTFLAKPRTYFISDRSHRCIQYADGIKRLFDIETDPDEWTNLAKIAGIRGSFRYIPKTGSESFLRIVRESEIGEASPSRGLSSLLLD
jgi:hypothetical protein